MGKVTLEGLRKPDDPIHSQTTIVIGGVTKRRSKRSDQKNKQDREPSPEAKSENANIEETDNGTV